MFPLAYCLNIDKRFSERERIQGEWTELGVRITFFLAGDGSLSYQYDHVDVKSPGLHSFDWSKKLNSYNAFLCFKKMIARAKRINSPSLLVLEDDVQVLPRAKEVLTRALEDLPARWDLFYVGANHRWGQTEKVTDNLLRLRGGSLCWHAVAVNKHAYEKILSLPMEGPIDLMSALVTQRQGLCYACWPSVAVQKPGWSYCEAGGSEQDYSHYWDAIGLSDNEQSPFFRE